MKKSEEFKNVVGALIKAQAEFRNLAKAKDNPFFHSKYADLGQMVKMAQPILAKYELALIQIPESDPERPHRIKLETVIMHSSGEWISGDLSMQPTPPSDKKKKKPEGKRRRAEGDDEVPSEVTDEETEDETKRDPTPLAVGAAITFARRYAMGAMLRIASEDEDADGMDADLEAAQNALGTLNQELAEYRQLGTVSTLRDLSQGSPDLLLGKAVLSLSRQAKASGFISAQLPYINNWLTTNERGYQVQAMSQIKSEELLDLYAHFTEMLESGEPVETPEAQQVDIAEPSLAPAD